MTQQYYAILTDYGSQQLAQAIAARQPLDITHFAVGDGNGRETTPNPSYTALVQEVYRANISAVSKDPRNNQQVIFELTIPENVGGFYIREMGIFDAQNKLVGYANSPESFKPTEQSGSGKIQVIRMILRVSSSDAVQLTVDNSVIFASRHQLTPKNINASSQNNVDETGHSHQIAQASTAQAGITQLDSSTNSNSETKAATSKAVKDLNDSKVSKTGNETVAGNKKFTGDTKVTKPLEISDTEGYNNQNHKLRIGSNDGDAWLEYKAGNQNKGVLRIRADGRLTFQPTNQSEGNVFHAGNKPRFNEDIQNKPNTLVGYGITNFKVETATGDLNTYRTDGIYAFVSRTNSSNRPGDFTGNLQVISGGVGNERWCHQTFKRHYSDETYERYQVSGDNDNWSEWKKVGSDGVPVGSVVAFPKEIANPQGFLRCDGATFSQSTYPDLYRVLGNKNRLPNLTRSDVGMMAWFPQDNIPSGWLACNGGAISNTDYPELHRYLNNKYGTNKLPNPEDRFIRNAGNGLRVGDKQKASVMAVNDNDNSVMGVRLINDDNDYRSVMATYGLDPIHSRDYANVAQVYTGHGVEHSNLATEDNTADNHYHQAGGVRPKSIIFKLCIKARNTFDDVQFWIKAFGEVINSGAMDASQLAQNLQDKADRAHTHTVSQIADFNPEVVKLINQHSGFTQQIAESGWTVLPNGLMLQWGVSNSTEIYFPRAFPVRCFVVSHSKTAGNRDTRVNNITNTKFNSYASSHPGTTYYIAIGH